MIWDHTNAEKVKRHLIFCQHIVFLEPNPNYKLANFKSFYNIYLSTTMSELEKKEKPVEEKPVQNNSDDDDDDYDP